MSYEETCAYFVKIAKEDFSIVEKNLSSIIKEVKTSIKEELNYIEEFDEENVLAQLEVLRERHKEKRFGKLFGVPITVKDAIVVKDIESKAGSKILKGYKPLFDATVIKKLREEGAIILAKTTQDEFGFGTFSTNTEKIPKNPFDNKRSCGGSSGGSGGFTAYTKNYHISLGESTGGSIAAPASFCGVVGLTPTYGMVSRNGLIDYANSLDKIGAVARNVDDATLLLEVISGADENDSTNISESYKKEEVSIKKIGIIKELLEGSDEEVKKVFLTKVEQLKKYFKVEEVSLPLNSEYALSAYYIIATSEASTNLAKLCGLRYGVQKDVNGSHFDKYFSNVRSENFSSEAKRRILLGTFARMSGFRDAYYLKSMKLRTKLINEFKSLFENYDVLIAPTMPIISPEFDSISKLTPMQNYTIDQCTVPANLAGLPHISINAGFVNKMPSGFMAISDHLNENKLYSVAKVIENE
jgi:aspartyl-tRNA(Asn)/glutamyl-tRNA(Gln) amidotransferase subunit A